MTTARSGASVCIDAFRDENRNAVRERFRRNRITAHPDDRQTPAAWSAKIRSTSLFADELAYQRAPLREERREERRRAEVATNSHALRASRLSGTREAGEAESAQVVRASRASTRSARCLTRRICLETNENRRVRFESPPSHPASRTQTPRRRWTTTSSPCGRGAGWRPSGSSARKPREVRRCLQISPRGGRHVFSSRRPRSVVLFLPG